MSLEEIRVNSEETVAEAEKQQKLQEEYENQCKRIYGDILAANKALGGKVAIEVMHPYAEEPELLLAGAHTEHYGQGNERHIAFLLSKWSIYWVEVETPDIPNWTGGYSDDPVKRYDYLERCSTGGFKKEELKTADLQDAIDLSLKMAIPKNPPVSPGELGKIHV